MVILETKQEMLHIMLTEIFSGSHLTLHNYGNLQESQPNKMLAGLRYFERAYKDTSNCQKVRINLACD